jgi:hypothetical protein
VNELKNRVENEQPICPVCNDPMPFVTDVPVQPTPTVSVTAQGWAMHAECASATR